MYKAAADDLDVAVTPDQAREEVYGMPYAEWKARMLFNNLWI